MAWGFGEKESTAKIVKKAITREAKVVGANIADTLHTVGDRAEHTISNAKVSAKTFSQSLWSFISSTIIPLMASLFREPNVVLLGRCVMATMLIQGVLGFLPHIVSNKFNQSQFLSGLNIFAMAFLSFRNQPILAFQQVIPLVLLCCYGLYLCVGSLNLRKFQPAKSGNGNAYARQGVNGNSPLTRSLPQALKKFAFWFRQALFVFLICLPILLANNKVISPKNVPVSTTTWSTWFGDIQLPQLNIASWFAPMRAKYSVFDIRNLDWNNIVGGIIALLGVGTMVFSDVQNRIAKKQQHGGESPEPMKNRQEYQSQVQLQRSARFLKRILSMRLPSYLSEIVFLFGLYMCSFNSLEGVEKFSVVPPVVYAFIQSLVSILQVDSKKLPTKLKNSAMFQRIREQSKSILPYVF